MYSVTNHCCLYFCNFCQLLSFILIIKIEIFKILKTQMSEAIVLDRNSGSKTGALKSPHFFFFWNFIVKKNCSVLYKSGINKISCGPFLIRNFFFIRWKNSEIRISIILLGVGVVWFSVKLEMLVFLWATHITIIFQWTVFFK